MVVAIKNLPAQFDSLPQKYDFLTDLYQELIALSNRLDSDTISFIADRTYH